jgi:hypothetical protein
VCHLPVTNNRKNLFSKMCVLSAGAADSDEEQEGNDEEEEDAEGGEGEEPIANGGSRNGRGGSPSSSTNR